MDMHADTSEYLRRHHWVASHVFHPAWRHQNRRLYLALLAHLQHSIQHMVPRSSNGKRCRTSPSSAGWNAARLSPRKRHTASSDDDNPASPSGRDHLTTPSAPADFLSAAQSGDLRTLKRLLKHRDLPLDYQDPATGSTALALACEAGHSGVVQLLLTRGADCYLYDKEDVSPLMKAARNGHDGILMVLLEEGEADAYHCSASGRNAMMEAAATGSTDCIEALISSGGADVNACNDQTDDSPLLEAVRHGHLRTAKFLIEHGAKVNHANKEGLTSLLLAARNGDTVMVELLLSKKAKCIPEFGLRRTPLMEAACNGHLNTVVALLKSAVAQVQAMDSSNHTAAQLAGSPKIRSLLQQHMAMAH